MSNDRDVLVHKHPRAESKPGVPVEVEPEVTGQYEGEELARIRAKRPTHERLARMEAKHDRLAESVTGIDKTLAGMGGKLDTVLDFLKTDRDNHHTTERVRIGSRAKVIIGIATALAAIASAAVTAGLAGCL